MADLGARLTQALTALRIDKDNLDHDQLAGLRDAIDGAFEDGYAEGGSPESDPLYIPGMAP